MKRNIFFFLAGIALCLLGFFALNAYIYQEKQSVELPANTPKDATYVIDGQVVRLQDGYAESVVAPGSASKIITRYFGNEVSLDLDQDGREDRVFLLTQETGGSGTFYYAVGALNKEAGYEGTQALFLGDRIAPQSSSVKDGRIAIINYAERKAGEPMTTAPSIGKSVWLMYLKDTNELGQVTPDFEGEADPARMTLSMKTWKWVSAQLEDGRVLKPKKDVFSLRFSDEDARVSVTTDCNSGSGTYARGREGGILITDIATTKMACMDSQETEFYQFLRDTTDYHFTSKGELVLHLKFDSGTVTFR